MSRSCNCETDGQHYVRCTCCGQYVIEGEFEAHRHSCAGRPGPHPLKELEIVLNAGVYHLDSGEDGGTDNASDCLRDAAEILNTYFNALGFDGTGRPPVELEEAERRIAARLGVGEED